MSVLPFCILQGNRDERENIDVSLAQQDAQVKSDLMLGITVCTLHETANRLQFTSYLFLG